MVNHPQHAQLDDTTSPHSSSPHVAPMTGTDRAQCKVKLPKINLKSFNGDLITMVCFLDLVLVFNTSQSAIDKLNYFHLLLEHSAAETIAGYSWL